MDADYEVEYYAPFRAKKPHEFEQEQFTKHDEGKPATHLLPPLALLEGAKVLEFGARKYSPENWRLEGATYSRYYGAALRHLLAWKSGEDLDKETSLSHLAHAFVCVSFLLEMSTGDFGEDDR